MTTPQDTTIFFVGMGPAPSSPSTIIVMTPSSTTTNNNQSAGPTTTGGPVYTPAASSSLSTTTTTSRKRKLAAAFGDDKQYRPTSWPGANAPAAAAAATATTAVAVAAAAAQEGFPLPKRRRHARARPSARPTSAASCFADVDEAARGGPLGFARLMAGLPGGFEGHRSRTRGPDGGSGVVLGGVVRGLPGSGLPAVGPAGGLVFRMWPGREIRLGERGRRTGGVPAPLEWLVRERERRERVEREADEFLAGLEALGGG
ncbi:hypothetical protein DIS24_g10341, partial [Lasiodiplodia hormozganensis]